VKDRLNSFLRPERHDYTDSFKTLATPAAQPPRLKVVAA
jgi:hypothetical protein